MKQAKKKTEKNQLDAREDKLALMVQRGFLEMNDKFLEMNDKFLEMNDKFLEMNDKFLEVNKNIGKLKEEISGLREEIGDLSERVERVEDQLTDVLGNQDKMIKDIEDLKEENIMDIVIHERMEKRIVHLEKDIAKIKAKVKV